MAGHKKFRDLVKHINADPARRARIDAGKRAMDDIIALAELRERRGATQSAVANSLGTSQANVSKLESRIDRDRDVYLSTLSHYIEALGGRLEITAVFPDETITLTPAGESGVEGESQENAADDQVPGAGLRTARSR